MQRRGFLGLVSAIVGFRRLNATTIGQPPAYVACACDVETYGYLTPEIVTARGFDNGSVRVVFNGIDVTSIPKPFGTILACDDRAGYIEVLAKDWNDKYRRDPLDPTKLARERRYGHVRVTMRRLGRPWPPSAIQPREPWPRPDVRGKS